jgi:DnaJ-domain-containing protein 1
MDDPKRMRRLSRQYRKAVAKKNWKNQFQTSLKIREYLEESIRHDPRAEIVQIEKKIRKLKAKYRKAVAEKNWKNQFQISVEISECRQARGSCADDIW